jgi:hypothetical protein
MIQLAKHDKKIQQLNHHILELENLLKNNSSDISKKEKSNKYLTNVKKQFKEYDDAFYNLKEKQLNSFNALKVYLQSLNEEEYINEIQSDINEIEREIDKFK